jgi:hypothetical protein
MLKSLAPAVCALLIVFHTVSASPTPTPKAAKTLSAKGIKQMTLVEAAGPGPEVERFMSAFLLEMSDRGAGNIADARLAGARLDDVRGLAGDEFRKSWPAEAYLGVKVDACDIQGFRTTMPDEEILANGQRMRVTRVMTGYRVSCPATVTLVSAADGKVLSEVRVTGQTGDKLSTQDTEAEGLAAEDAAKKAAKKLVAALK